MLTQYRNTSILAATSAVIGAGFVLGALALGVGWLPFESHANELQLLPAILVQLICCAAMIWAAHGLRSQRPESYRGALVAHVGVIMGVLISLLSFGFGVGKSGHAITIYHVVMLVALLLNTAALWHIRPRHELKREPYRITARLS